jgi:Protein of unknown function (DUF4232)
LSKRLLAFAVALAAASIMAGCRAGPSGQPAAGAATTPTSPAETPSVGPVETPSEQPSATAGGQGGGAGANPKPGRCRTENLRATLRPFEWPGHAGAEQDAELGLTNLGRRPCILEGYAGLRLLGADGEPRSTKVIRMGNRPVRPILLDPNGTGWALVAWTFMPNVDEENTSPLCGGRVTQIRVTPPGNTAARTVTAKIGTVCQHGEIAVGPFQPTRPSASPPS